MKKILLPLLYVWMAFIVPQAKAQCTSYFQSVYNPITGAVDFTPLCIFDTTIQPVLYVWDFGDGVSTVDINPSHQYAAANNYLVCLYLFVGNGPGCCQDT